MVQLGAFERYLIEEFYDDYRDGLINKGTFTRPVAFIQGSMAATAVAMTAVGCGPDELPEAETPMPPIAATAVPPSVVSVDTSTPVIEASSEANAPDPAMAEPGIEAEEMVLPDSDEEVAGYFAKPAGDGPFPAVPVCHENRGLVDHIRDVTRRFAGEGYVALALDLLWREGGTEAFDRDAVPGVLTGAGAERHLADFQQAFA